MVPERETPPRERAASGATAASVPGPAWTSPPAPRRGQRPSGTRSPSGRLSERVARFLGTGRFIVWMTVVIILWVCVERVRAEQPALRPVPVHLPDADAVLQASTGPADPSSAQNRQDDRDRVNLEQDRKQNERSIADTST